MAETPNKQVLVLVAAAAGAKAFAEHSYRESIVEAAKTHSYAEIARAAGISRQAVRMIVLKSQR
ncbi:MAG: hypothetical protein WC565_03055 [Parcubacteria group bacterium]